MHKLLLLGLSALLFCTIAHGIVCNVCSGGNGKLCYSKVELCKTDTGKCYTYASYLDKELYYVSYDCLHHDYLIWYCNKTEKDERYTHVATCCETDKCNGEIPRLPWS
nr:lymphocyte antigen 6 complex locus protein G6c-like [Pogona vitticeps]